LAPHLTAAAGLAHIAVAHQLEQGARQHDPETEDQNN
jgi:hypothetical protein